MTLLVKICGLRTPETLEAALDAGADLVGFVFFPLSPRHVQSATAEELGALRGGSRGWVGLEDSDSGGSLDVLAVVAEDLLVEAEGGGCGAARGVAGHGQDFAQVLQAVGAAAGSYDAGGWLYAALARWRTG